MAKRAEKGTIYFSAAEKLNVPFSAGFTDALNQVEYAYDGWGNLITEKQEHDGAVDGNTLFVQHTYDWDDDTQTDEAAPYLRLAKITYPDGREVYYNYASGIADDDLDNGSRTVYAQYSYLGAGTIVTVEHPGVTGGLTLDYGADGSDGWDRFGRVTGQTWTNAAETTTFDDFAYTYDRASNRLTRDLSLTTGLDEEYTYDALGRLTNAERGTLSAGSIMNATFGQDWSLDELGNWSEFAEDADGDGTPDLDQARAHNDANEITGITETAGPAWIDPAHDAAGNMTLAARPGDEADANDGLVLVYDAWNRVVKVYDDNDADGQADEGELIVSYAYDGQRRLVEKTIEGDPDVTYDNYYNSEWQLLELRRSDDPDPQDQYVWDLRYIDAPVARFHDGNTDGDYDDAEDNVLYYTTDAKFNVTAVIDDSGNVVERYAYDPYGAVTVLDGTTGGQTDWATDADQVSDVANEILYSGYRFDAATALYIVRNRIYHPTLGRWVQRDPLGYVDGMSKYEFVRSRPTIGLDSAGEQFAVPQSPQMAKAQLELNREIDNALSKAAAEVVKETTGVVKGGIKAAQIAAAAGIKAAQIAAAGGIKAAQIAAAGGIKAAQIAAAGGITAAQRAVGLFFTETDWETLDALLQGPFKAAIAARRPGVRDFYKKALADQKGHSPIPDALGEKFCGSAWAGAALVFDAEGGVMEFALFKACKVCFYWYFEGGAGLGGGLSLGAGTGQVLGYNVTDPYDIVGWYGSVELDVSLAIISFGVSAQGPATSPTFLESEPHMYEFTEAGGYGLGIALLGKVGYMGLVDCEDV